MKISRTSIEMHIDVWEPDEPNGISEKAAIQAAEQHISQTLGPGELTRWHYAYTTWRSYNTVTITFEM